jgi:NADH-quinone oxidoreductase subunit E
MLSEEEKQEIESKVARYGEKRAACTEALAVVQRHRGWVSDQGIKDVARILEMTTDEVDGLATFYSLIFRRPVGRHVILICDSVSCWIMGYEDLLQHLQRRLGINLGETTPDERFTLLPVACLGACDRAPALMIDDDLHTDLDADKVDKILKVYE